jgi:hypothetical protein
VRVGKGGREGFAVGQVLPKVGLGRSASLRVGRSGEPALRYSVMVMIMEASSDGEGSCGREW